MHSISGLHGYNSTERHCVFTCHANWFALPAVCVREVCPTPALIGLPRTRSLLAGICHVRSEFLPVVQLVSGVAENSDSRMLVLSGPQGNWGLLANHVYALESLEATHVGNLVSDDVWSAAVVGSALYRDQVVTLLEPQRLYRVVEQTLSRHWEFAETLRGVPAAASAFGVEVSS